MRGSLLGSMVVHFALVGLLWVVRPTTSIIVPGPEVVQVSLLDPSALAAASAPAPVPPAPARPEPVAEEPEGVRIERPKPKPRDSQPAPERPTRAREDAPPPPPRQSPANLTTLPVGPMAGAGMRGQVSVDAKDFEFTYYLVLVRNAIARNWTPPSTGGGTAVRATIYFRIARDGSVRAVSVEQGSGIDFFDQSASRAVVVSDPLPPLPLGWSGSELGVHFGFEYTGP